MTRTHEPSRKKQGTEGGDSSFTWAVAAPFLDTVDSLWISDFTSDDRHRFQKIPHGGSDSNWHTKAAKRTGLAEWREFSRTSGALLDAALEQDGGAITVFPQLAASAAWKKRVRRFDVPLVAWFFNTTFGRDARSILARPALRGVDRFVVHSTNEIEAYAGHLKLPVDRFSFAFVQYGGAIQTDEENTDEPFVFATGSGFRDYETFFDAMATLDVPAKVVAGPRVLAGLTPPPNVEILEGVDRHGIHRLVRQATVNVLPMNNDGLTAGLVTMAEAFRHGRSLVVSERRGIDDYVQHEENALLVPLRDSNAMAESIRAVLEDRELRERLNKGAFMAGEVRHTDDAAGRRLVEVLDSVLDGRAD